MRRRAIVACATASLVFGLGWQVSAFARPLEGPHAAVITTSTGISAPGGSLIVNGQNFVSDESIVLTLFSHGVPIGSTSSNGSGSFSTSVTIPSGTTPGEHTIIATGGTGDSAGTGIDVLNSQTTAAPSVASLGSGPTASAPASAPATAAKTLRLSRITLVPGQGTVMSGHGCTPGAKVVVSINGREVALTTANSQGAFSAALTPLDQGVGQVRVTATCGSKSFVAFATLVTTAKVSAPEGSVAVFGTFVLLGAVLVRGQFGSTAARRRRRRRAASDILGTA
jgi:hypothetical protein